MKKEQQDKKEQIKELTNLLEDGVKKLRSSEEWKRFLQVEAKFPQYSFRNCMLIMLQTEGKATRVMSYTGWKSLDRYPVKGSKGIKILAPCPYKKDVLVDARDEKGNVIYKADGTPEQELVTKVQEAYKIAYTFDVSQTEGKPLPEICTRLEGEVDGFETLKEVLMEVSPVPITFEKIESEANGYYSPATKQIVIEESLSERQKVKTILHEIGHAWLDLNGKDKDVDRRTKEVEAESISFVVMNNLLGDSVTPEDVGQYSFGYIGSWSSDDNLKEMKKALHTIQQTSFEIIKKVEACMAKRLEAKEAEQTEQKQEVGETSARVATSDKMIADEVNQPSRKMLRIHM